MGKNQTSRIAREDIVPLESGKRICIVASELEGPFFNGGVGTTNRWLAMALRQLGHSVDVVYIQVKEGLPVCLRGTFSGHVAEYALEGIQLRAIFTMSTDDDWPSRSWLVMQHLIAERYDLVFFDDLFGMAYYPLLARHTGATALAQTVMVVTAHGALEWVSEQEQTSILNFESMKLFEMERRSLELADIVKAPSQYILDTYIRYGWALPPNTVVLPNFVSDPVQHVQIRTPVRTPVDEIVFFGRLETRKGIWLFLRAIDRIKYKLDHRTVTFLGKSRSNGAAILNHTLSWPCKVRFLSSFNQEQAVAYMRGPGRLAIMPSPADNSPSTVLECLDYGIPFLTTAGSGAAELIDPVFHEANLVAPRVDALAEKMLQILESGGSTARHRFDPDRLRSAFATFLEHAFTQNRPTVSTGEVRGVAAIIAQAQNDDPPAVTAAKVRQILPQLQEGTILHVLSDQPEAVQGLLTGTGVHVFASAAFAASNLCESADELRAVSICSIAAMPGAAWLDRAQTCFARGIRAVTGMTRSFADAPKPPEDPWFIDNAAPPVERYLMGNCAALMQMACSSNSGFAIFDPGLLPLLAKVDDRKLSFGGMQLLTVTIDSFLSALVETGERFELIPDLALHPVKVDVMASRAADAVSAQQALLNPLNGDDALWVIRRLGGDAIREHSRRVEAEAYRNALALRIAFPINPVTTNTPRDRQISDLARLAMATGQVNLATELLAGLHPAMNHDDATHLQDFVRSQAAAIHLFERKREGKCTDLNLIHDYSLKAVSDTEVHLHANSMTEPRAALSFSDIDLANLDVFLARVFLPDIRSRPVRLRIDVIANSSGEHLVIERVLQPGNAESLRIPLPSSLRAPCRVIVGVEMADPQALHSHAYLGLINPRFQRLARQSEA